MQAEKGAHVANECLHSPTFLPASRFLLLCQRMPMGASKPLLTVLMERSGIAEAVTVALEVI
jgi:hypothetical protein